MFRRSFTPYFYRSTFLIFSLQVKKIYCKTTTSNNVRSVKYGSINANRKVDKHSLARYKTKTWLLQFLLLSSLSLYIFFLVPLQRQTETENTFCYFLIFVAAIQRKKNMGKVKTYCSKNVKMFSRIFETGINKIYRLKT